jgi:signal transduction histidine kinase
MRERAEILGGSFAVISSPNQGIRVSLPLGVMETKNV